MNQKAYIRPSKTALIAGIIAACAMLAFGIFFFALLADSGNNIGRVFLTFWIFIVLGIAGYFGYSLLNYDTKPGAGAAEEIVLTDVFNKLEKEESFDSKLRKLNDLHKEGLISDAEFETKRKVIMNEKW